MIQVERITKFYNGHKGVHDITFTVGNKEICGVVGPNGSGKTTLLKLIVGLLRPDSGQIKIAKLDIQENPIETKKLLGYVPEDHFLYEKMTAYEFLSFISEVRKIPVGVKEKEIKKLLSTFALSEQANDCIGTYSLGMQRKVALAAGLLASPPVLVLDEAINALDPMSIYTLKNILLERAANGCTILLSTHILSFAEEICNKVIILNKGKIITEEILTIPKDSVSQTTSRLEKLFLETIKKKNDES